MKKKLLPFAIATLTMAATMSYAQAWKLVGNSGTNPNTNFVGTTDNTALIFRTNNVEAMRITKFGGLAIGTTGTGLAKLDVDHGQLVSLTAPGYVILGAPTGYNLAMDNSNIQARINGKAASLNLNAFGGTTYAGSTSNSNTGLVAFGTSSGLNAYADSSGGTGVNGGGPSDGTGVAGSGGLYGTFGYSTGGYGVYGQGASGAYGVEAYSNLSIGIYAATGGTNTYAGFFVGDLYTTGSYLPSDQKLKQNIKDVSTAMDIINALHPKQYEYRQDGDYKLMNLPQGNRFGLLAQDVEKVLPGLVKESRFNTKDLHPTKPEDQKTPNAQPANTIIEFKAVNYTELIPVIIKGMQEQQQTIQTQQQQIQAQQQQIDKLTQMLEAIAGNSSALQSATLNTNGAFLLQNAPNPFSQSTTIACYVPSAAKQAQLVVFNADGSALKTFSLNNKGRNEVTVTGDALASGAYSYSLMIDGKMADSKKMILTK
jgi:hypothetical protein